EMISKIGDPFFTGKESGTGLGIMVSQRIILNHKGNLDFQSQENVGTTVHVSLPALKPLTEDGILEASLTEGM
ncbi:ATP-binding protein, partial [Paenibacillus sp. MCAF20]